jgi:hypothetical protein
MPATWREGAATTSFFAGHFARMVIIVNFDAEVRQNIRA